MSCTDCEQNGVPQLCSYAFHQQAAQQFMNLLFAVSKHGDEKHQEWLKDLFQSMVPTLQKVIKAQREFELYDTLGKKAKRTKKRDPKAHNPQS